MDNTCFLSSRDHVGIIRKKVKKFRKSNFLTDIHIVGRNGSVFLHKIILFQQLPQITSFLCDYCDHHAETTFILPEVSAEEIEREVKNLYAFGIVSGIEELLGVHSSKNSLRIKLENETKVMTSEIMTGSNDVNEDSTNYNEEEIKDTLLISEKVVDHSTNELVNVELENDKKVKFELKTIKELEEHSFEFLPSHSSSNPGILLVDNLYKYFYNSTITSKLGIKLFYACSSVKKTKCKATSILFKDDDGNMVMEKCSSEAVHNHEVSKGKVIVGKMKKEMLDMIKVYF